MFPPLNRTHNHKVDIFRRFNVLCKCTWRWIIVLHFYTFLLHTCCTVAFFSWYISKRLTDLSFFDIVGILFEGTRSNFEIREVLGSVVKIWKGFLVCNISMFIFCSFFISLFNNLISEKNVLLFIWECWVGE